MLCHVMNKTILDDAQAPFCICLVMGQFENIRYQYQESALHFVQAQGDGIKYFYSFSSQPLWIGLNDLQTEGVFRWLDGYPLDNVINWAPGHPTGGTDKNCVAYHLERGFQTMNCSDVLPVVCESPTGSSMIH